MRLITDERWNAAVGEAARRIGGRDYHEVLLGLVELLIPHDMSIAARYSRYSPVDILHYRGVPRHVIELFRSKYYNFDPFYAYWRERGEAGVVTLAMATAGSRRNSPYRRVFQPQAHIADEIGLFLPVVGGASIGLFLERSTGAFTAAEARLARSVYPLIAGLYRAHIGREFASLSERGATGRSFPRPTMITDRDGRTVFASRSWRAFDAAEPALAAALRELEHGKAGQAPLPGDHVLIAEPLDAHSPIAPLGRMHVVEKRGLSPVTELPSTIADTPLGAGLTPRERQITDLILKGASNEAIAGELGLARGTVKNHRRRLYLKLGIESERELFLRYLEVLSETGRRQPQW